MITSDLYMRYLILKMSWIKMNEFKINKISYYNIWYIDEKYFNKKNNIQISWKYNDIIFILIFRLVLAINNIN